MPVAIDDTSIQHLLPGTRIGRYLILSTVGRGAVGTVYAAYDTQLERKVALKLLHSRGGPLSEAGARDRLLREAQALAQVRDPNVVTVFDAAFTRDVIYIAMELVEGESLRQWLETPRSWRQTLSLLLATGHGLSSIHGADIVHRDFKPDNVFVDLADRPRVGDFGLAGRGGESAEGMSEAVEPTLSEKGLLAAQLTETGVVLGTPAYMSPEHFDRTDITARSDQFSFCVCAIEALFGERPFQGASYAELDEQVHAGVVTSPSAGAPKRLWKILKRGLSVDPGDRYSSIDVLLDELRRSANRTRVWAASAAGVAVLAVLMQALMAGPKEEPALCSDPQVRLDAVWSPAHSASALQAFEDTGISFAEAQWAENAKRIETYANGWLGLHAQVCAAAEPGRPEQLEELKLQETCLQQRLWALGALVTSFGGYSDTDAVTMGQSLDRVAELKPLHECLDRSTLNSTRLPADEDKALAQRERFETTYQDWRAPSGYLSGQSRGIDHRGSQA